jgi:hypothetical protein
MICVEKFNSERKFATMKCNHPFCAGCIARWRSLGDDENHQSCPYCRKIVEGDNEATALSIHSNPTHTDQLSWTREIFLMFTSLSMIVLGGVILGFYLTDH